MEPRRKVNLALAPKARFCHNRTLIGSVYESGR
jgi:hypothetical protein